VMKFYMLVRVLSSKCVVMLAEL